MKLFFLIIMITTIADKTFTHFVEVFFKALNPLLLRPNLTSSPRVAWHFDQFLRTSWNVYEFLIFFFKLWQNIHQLSLCGLLAHLCYNFIFYYFFQSFENFLMPFMWGEAIILGCFLRLKIPNEMKGHFPPNCIIEKYFKTQFSENYIRR